jgi:hypothetical protein
MHFVGHFSLIDYKRLPEDKKVDENFISFVFVFNLLQ